MADEDKEKKGKGKLIAIVGVLVLLGAGSGFFFLKGGEPAKGSEGAAQVEAESEAEETAEADAGAIYELDPFIVNLADAGELRYLKVSMKLQLTKAKYADTINNHIPQIRDSMLILLSSKDSKSIRTTEGKMELQDEIVQRVNGLFEDNKVTKVYFTDFVTQ